MREKADIDELLAALREAMLAYPELRLGQLLIHALQPLRSCPELFDVEDADLRRKLVRVRRQKRRLQSAETFVGIAFEVEASLEIDGHGYVFARALTDTPFEVRPGATLDSVPIERWLEWPNARGEDGQLRTDLHAFCLVRVDDMVHFESGDVVELLHPDGA